jgi:hypothetical protein
VHSEQQKFNLVRVGGTLADNSRYQAGYPANVFIRRFQRATDPQLANLTDGGEGNRFIKWWSRRTVEFPGVIDPEYNAVGLAVDGDNVSFLTGGAASGSTKDIDTDLAFDQDGGLVWSKSYLEAGRVDQLGSSRCIALNSAAQVLVGGDRVQK